VTGVDVRSVSHRSGPGLTINWRSRAVGSGNITRGTAFLVMVSYDHFKIALLTRLRIAESEGQTEIAVNSVEFCNSFRRGPLNVQACCQAMKDEMKVGDVIQQDSADGLTIRYQLRPKEGAN
jgi:hypothetical protein